MYCESPLLTSKDITLVKDNECNLLQILVPMNRLKSIFGEQYVPSDSGLGEHQDNYVLEIGCEIKSVNKILIADI